VVPRFAHGTASSKPCFGSSARSASATPRPGFASKRTTPSSSGQTPERRNAWNRGHWRIENGSHYVRDAAFAEDASHIRKNLDIVARLRSFVYNTIRTAGRKNVRNARWRAALDIAFILKTPRMAENQTCLCF
jgi:hypothetical protein